MEGKTGALNLDRWIVALSHALLNLPERLYAGAMDPAAQFIAPDNLRERQS
jgi:hypothetical protein